MPISPLTGELQVFTLPGAQIELDGKPAGTADKAGELLLRELSVCGTHRLVATRDGFDRQERETTVSPGIVSTVTLELKAVQAVEPSGTLAPTNYQPHRRLMGPAGSEPMALFRHDGRQLITWTRQDPKVSIWDPETGRQVKTFTLATDDRVLAASSDLHWLAITAEQSVVRILDLETGQDRSRFRASSSRLGDSRYVKFSPDSKRLAAVSEDSAGVWEVESGKKLFSFPQHPSVGYIFWVPDGRQLITGNTSISVWDAETGAEIRQVAEKVSVRGLELSPDGRLVSLDHYSDELKRWQVEIRDTATGRIIRTFTEAEQGAGLTGMGFLPNSPFVLILTSHSTLHLWDLQSGREAQASPSASKGAVSSVAVSPDGRWIVTCTSRTEFTIWRRSR